MNRVKPSGGKHSLKGAGGKRPLIRALSLVATVLGVGCIVWAMFNIWTQTGYAADDTNTVNSRPIASVAELNKIKINSTEPVESNLSQESLTPNQPLYAEHPSEGDNIGSLTIPAINRKVPIIQGTDAAELKKGAGHFTQSVLPGEKDNCVISGHRDTVFRQIGNLKLEDEIIVQTSAGTFTYKVSETRIVHKNDKTVIVPTDHAVLTLTTCYPFNFVGSAPDRYIVSANLVKNK